MKEGNGHCILFINGDGGGGAGVGDDHDDDSGDDGYADGSCMLMIVRRTPIKGLIAILIR